MNAAPCALVVDDYDDAREMYAEFLAYKGYEVIQAQTGVEAVAQAMSRLPDVVILDLALPDIDGIEVARRLKQASETARIPIVMVTAHAHPKKLDEAREVGCVGVLIKPCTPEELLGFVQRFAKDNTAGSPAPFVEVAQSRR